MPGPRLRGRCKQRLSRGPGAFTPQMPNVGGMEGAGETQLYKGTCKFLVTKTGGDRYYLLVCRRQRIGHKETLHRRLGWGEVRAQQGPLGLCTQGPTQG